MISKETITFLEKRFIDEDKAEPFGDRKYVEETLRLFNVLKNGYDADDKYPTNRAFLDIIYDITENFDKTRYHLPK